MTRCVQDSTAMDTPPISLLQNHVRREHVAASFSLCFVSTLPKLQLVAVRLAVLLPSESASDSVSSHHSQF